MLHSVFPHGSLRRVVAGNTVSQLIGKAVSTISIIIVSLLIANRYGPDGYGDFVKITTFVGFFYLFADFGLNAIYLQRVSDRNHTMSASIDSLWQALFGLRLLISGILTVIAVSILSLLPEGLNQGYTPLVRFGIILFAPVIVTQAVITTANAFFQKQLRYDVSAAAQIAGSLTMLAVVILLSAVSPFSGALLGIVALLTGSIVTLAVSLLSVNSFLHTIVPVYSKQTYRSLFRSGAPLGFALVFNLVYFHADSVIMTLTRSTYEVGIYGLAYKIFELPLVLPIFFMNAIYPLMLRADDTEKNNQRSIFLRSLQFLIGSSLLISAVVWLGSPVVGLVRPEFTESVAPLRVLVLGFPVFFVSALFMWYLIAKKQQTWLLVIHGIAMLGNILMNLRFIPQYGSMAAARITVCSEFFVLIATGILVYKMMKNSHKGGLT